MPDDIHLEATNRPETRTAEQYTNDQIQRIQELLNKGMHRLKFPKDYEKDFQEYYATRFSLQIRIIVLVGLMLYVGFAMMERLLIHHVNPMGIIFDYHFWLPIITISLLLFVMQRFSKYQQLSLTILTLGLSISLVLILQAGNGELDFFYFMGMLLLQVYSFNFIRLQFWSALGCALGLFFIYLAALMFTHVVLETHAMIFCFFYVATSAVALAANYCMELYVRKNYLTNKMLLFQADALRMINQRLQTITETDGLTGIFNRYKLDLALRAEWDRCKRHQKSYSVLLIDIDYFKQYNDSYGHLKGDEVLRRVASILKAEAIRSSDLAARYGGDEFCVLMPETPVEGLKHIAQVLLDRVSQLEIPHHGSAVVEKVTLSIGGASIVPPKDKKEGSLKHFLQKVDNALYEAKHQGRNTIVLDSGF